MSIGLLQFDGSSALVHEKTVFDYQCTETGVLTRWVAQRYLENTQHAVRHPRLWSTSDQHSPPPRTTLSTFALCLNRSVVDTRAYDRVLCVGDQSCAGLTNTSRNPTRGRVYIQPINSVTLN